MSGIKVLYAENQPLSIEGMRSILSNNYISENFYTVQNSELIDSGIIAYEPDLFIIDYNQKNVFSISDIEKITNIYHRLIVYIYK